MVNCELPWALTHRVTCKHRLIAFSWDMVHAVLCMPLLNFVIITITIMISACELTMFLVPVVDPCLLLCVSLKYLAH